jgi:hypothetical protein
MAVLVGVYSLGQYIYEGKLIVHNGVFNVENPFAKAPFILYFDLEPQVKAE